MPIGTWNPVAATKPLRCRQGLYHSTDQRAEHRPTYDAGCLIRRDALLLFAKIARRCSSRPMSPQDTLGSGQIAYFGLSRHCIFSEAPKDCEGSLAYSLAYGLIETWPVTRRHLVRFELRFVDDDVNDAIAQDSHLRYSPLASSFVLMQCSETRRCQGSSRGTPTVKTGAPGTQSGLPGRADKTGDKHNPAFEQNPEPYCAMQVPPSDYPPRLGQL